MNCEFDLSVAQGYTSSSQKARVLTESWAAANLYCPRCGYSTLSRFPNNKAVADFFCSVCGNEYELKSKNGQIGHKIPDGAYDTFIKRITSNNNPDFLVLSYSFSELCAESLWVVPKHFFTPDIVEKRTPLSESARRTGWVGCNILFDAIPTQGKICIIENKSFVDKATVLSRIQQASRLATNNLDARGWLLDVLNCVNRIQSETFSLNDMYQFYEELQLRHPNNHNIRPKIRQQLQALRDKGFIIFLERGIYKKVLY